MIHKEENQSIETDPKLTQILELAAKNIKRVIITCTLYVQKLSRDTEYIK